MLADNPVISGAIERSPFHTARLAGIDVGRFELGDLSRLPVMSKAQMMASFDQIVTDRRLNRRIVERHLAQSDLEPGVLLGDYVCLASGGSSGLRDVFVQTLGEYTDFVAVLFRRALARKITDGGPASAGLVVGIVSAASPVHSSGFGAATATGSLVRMIAAPASMPIAEIVERLNAAQAPALLGYASKLAQLAREQREGRLRIAPLFLPDKRLSGIESAFDRLGVYKRGGSTASGFRRAD
jgi:phenylacetate-coenzyme A ligase PaaK-like adenylate-forming protein